MAGTEEAVAAAVAVGCEIAPRGYELKVRGPTVLEWDVDVYLVRWVGRRSTPAHDPHLLRQLRE